MSFESNTPNVNSIDFKSKKQTKKATAAAGVRLKDKAVQDTRRRIDLLREQAELSEMYGMEIELNE